MKYSNILEEEVKNKVTQDFFQKFDCTRILGKIDFAVALPSALKRGVFANVDVTMNVERTYLLWAEAKQKPADVVEMLTQLVLTIGKARTFDEILPPPFLGCFDNEKIAFIPYSEIQNIFYQNDFNWKVTPSNHETREFKQVYDQIKNIISPSPTLSKQEGARHIPWQTYIFNFEKDERELKRFIRENFVIGKIEISKTRIDKNNFITIYNKWLATVKPTIAVKWDKAKARGIIDGDFYLADLLSAENKTLKEKLFVLLHDNHYEFDRIIDEDDIYNSKRAEFSDNQKAHEQFWAKYERPPLEEYWDYIIDRRDLIVPQDVRERKGSFYTPGIWVELSQKYLADVFGEDWQEEYYVWDCAAGTGNLLAGLINKNNLWASTLDKQDVDVMYDRIENGANLWKQQVFQFDFLNDDFIPISKGGKLPDELYEIISDTNKRKKLIIYINPPYAETNAKKGTQKGITIGKVGLNLTSQREKYEVFLGKGKRELYAQFMVRIYKEIPCSKIAVFSKLKILNAPFYVTFRNNFLAELKSLFICPASTFDNVKGPFPIGFQIWDTDIKTKFKKIESDVYEKEGSFLMKKNFYSYENDNYINSWILKYRQNKKENIIGKIFCVGSDFQHQSYCRINSQGIANQAGFTIIGICFQNLIECCIFYAVRKVIKATWLNDRDQFLYPNDQWKKDIEFQNDCLTYTLFNNDIQLKYGVNHWIPFNEKEVGSQGKFESHFMQSFISGKIIPNRYSDLFEQEEDKISIKREFSPEATKVFDAGRELWKYYHAIISSPFGGGREGGVNASLYDIREYFQGRNDKGKMNNKSDDEKYNELIENLRLALKTLAKKIEPKVYEYGFLKE